MDGEEGGDSHAENLQEHVRGQKQLDINSVSGHPLSQMKPHH